jgi:hypothetical protein
LTILVGLHPEVTSAIHQENAALSNIV